MTRPVRTPGLRRFLADRLTALAERLAPELMVLDRSKTARRLNLEETAAALRLTAARRLVEAIKGRDLLPGEDLDVEIHTATSILRRIGFTTPRRDGRTAQSIPLSASVAIELAGFVAPRASPSADPEHRP